MQERTILIAEDDQETRSSWERDIREFNRRENSTVVFDPQFATSRSEAIRILDRMRVDCASVDLRLPADLQAGAGASSPLGNDVLDRLLTESGIPAVVYSGYPQEISDRVRLSQIKVIPKRGGGAMEALNWLASHEALMSAMALTKSRIARECSQLFSQSIWPRWQDSWKSKAADFLPDVLTRQLVSHLAEKLALPPNAHHPEEFYVVPALNESMLGTGDLVRMAQDVYVVVTPRCNMANKSLPAHLMLAFCKPMIDDWKRISAKFAGSKEKQEKAARELRDYATQGHATSTHFLPPCGNEGPWLVDFREIRTVPSRDAAALLVTRFAAIATQFVPNLIQRYSAYLGRIGQPELDCEVLRQSMTK